MSVDFEKDLESMKIALDYRGELVKRAAELLRDPVITRFGVSVGMHPSWTNKRDQWLKDAGVEK